MMRMMKTVIFSLKTEILSNFITEKEKTEEKEEASVEEEEEGEERKAKDDL